MKKIMTMVLAGVMVCLLAGCGGNGGNNGSAKKSDSPSDVVAKYLDCAVKQDYKGMVKFLDTSVGATDEDLEEAAAVLELLYAFGDGVQSFEILGEEINDEGTEAEVKLKITDTKGKSRTDDADLVKTDQGWRIDFD